MSTAEQRAAAVRLVGETGSIPKVATDLGFTQSSLRHWWCRTTIAISGHGVEGWPCVGELARCGADRQRDFGASVALEDGLLISGAPNDGAAGTVHALDMATGVRRYCLTPNVGGSRFGAALAAAESAKS